MTQWALAHPYLTFLLVIGIAGIAGNTISAVADAISRKRAGNHVEGGRDD